MEQKIELEIKLRELAVQSMLEAQNEIDVLEVEKSLLTSDQRMNFYASQLEQQRKKLSNTSLSTDSGRGSQHTYSNSINSNSNNCNNRNGNNNHKRHSPSSQFSGSSPSRSQQSSNQSPSKLSPVSGESANRSPMSSPFGGDSNAIVGMNQSQSSGGTDKTHHTATNTTTTSGRRIGGAYRCSSSSSGNTMTARRRAKDKRRELLMQRITGASNINCNMVVDSRATLTISELRIPLMWRDVDHFKGRGDYKRFAIFCLLKVDSQIYDTQLISDVDRNVTDVIFDDVIQFNHVDHNFELTLEVYSCVYLEQFSFSSTPRKLKEKLSNSVGKAMGRRLATQMVSTNFTKELQAYDKSYRFAMIASAILRLDDASHSVKTYDLVLVTPSAHHRQSHNPNYYQSNYGIMSANLYNSPLSSNNNNNINSIYNPTSNTKDVYKNTLPLFGHFCCSLQVRPDVFNKSYKTGYLRVANMTASAVHWGLLRNFALHLWPVDEYALRSAIMAGQPPARLDTLPRAPLTLNLDKFTRLLRVSNSSLTIETPQGCFVLGAYCPEGGLLSQAEEMAHWLRSIEQPIYDSHIWGSVLGHHFPATPSTVTSTSTTTTTSPTTTSTPQSRHH